MAPDMIRRAYTKTRAIVRAIRCRVKVSMTDLSQLRYYVMFVGNPRSGTTLVRTLLDAHPNIVIGNEVHSLRMIKAGKDWTTVAGRILDNSSHFSKNPTWTGYSYKIEHRAINRDGTIRVIGDKRAAGSTKVLMEEPALLAKLWRWSPVPVRFIHCVRHPYDVIATRTRRNDLLMNDNRQRYFQLEHGVAEIFALLGPAQSKRIYHEELIANPTEVLQDMLHFLGETAEPAYLRACQSLIYAKPHQSRFSSEWTAQAIAEIEQETLHCNHLSYYLDQGRLLFDNAPIETTRERLDSTPLP